MRTVPVPLVGLLLFALLTGCGREKPADPVLLTVGDQAITLGEFQHAFNDILQQDQGGTRPQVNLE